MRILVFCDEDLSVASGGARQVLELCRGLAGRGHEVRVVAPSPRAILGIDAIREGLHLRCVPVCRAAGLRPLSYLIASGIVMAWEMVHRKPDALLWFDSPGQIAPLPCASLARCPYVLFVNGLPSEELRGFWRWPPLQALLMSALKHAARRASSVVSVCQEILVWMQAAWAVPLGRCHVIRNGVDPLQFHPADAREARRRLGLDETAPYIGFIGGFFPWHGLETLINAVPFVLRAQPNARFLLIGDGQTRQWLEAKVFDLGIQHAVTFPGRVGFQEVPQWISVCDVCVVLHRPTRLYPGDSMKLWEYLACARPVVATAGPGYGDTVEAVGGGVSAKPDDPEHLAQQLVSLLRDPEMRTKMGERGRMVVQRLHTWQARAEQLEALLIGTGEKRRHS